jgi:manganese oxidase
MVITPGIDDLPYIERQGVKYFELVAEPVSREILPGIFIQGWGYNGSIPGPTIKVYPEDCVSIRVYNAWRSQPVSTGMGWISRRAWTTLRFIPANILITVLG